MRQNSQQRFLFPVITENRRAQKRSKVNMVRVIRKKKEAYRQKEK